MKIRTRFAPSPTGFLHIGSLRTALYAYALSKHSKGDFILRIEDTDQKRFVENATDSLKKTLEIFNLHWDEYYVQSERVKQGIYTKAAEKLVEEGHAFYCECQPKNAKTSGFSNELRDPCREKKLSKGAIKLKVPDGQNISYFDFVHRKEISWNTDSVYDATLLKSDGFPTYHLAVVVDDTEMQISHILRGHDWLPSTPIHLLVFDYYCKKHPEIGHLTDILSPATGKKLSKRSDSVFVEQYLKDGYLPEALLNFVMLLGWAPKDNREIFTLDEFVQNFDLNGFQEANPKFFLDKLDWFNGQYIRKLDQQVFNSKLKTQNSKFALVEPDKQNAIANLIQDRIKKLSDFDELAGFFFEEKSVDTSLFGKNYANHLSSAIGAIQEISDWNLENLNNSFMDLIKVNNFKTGDFFMDLRIAVTGKKFTPPINESIVILGKEKTIERIKKVIN